MSSSQSLPYAAHQARVAAFSEALLASDGAASVWFSRDDCGWHARAETPDGLFVLEHPNGGGFPGLEGMLQLLSGVGAARITVEFDGLPPLYYDRVN